MQQECFLPTLRRLFVIHVPLARFLILPLVFRAIILVLMVIEVRHHVLFAQLEGIVVLGLKKVAPCVM